MSKYPDICVQLSGTDGNAFALLGKVQRALREHNLPNDVVDAFLEEAMAGDYDHLLRTCCDWVIVR